MYVRKIINSFLQLYFCHIFDSWYPPLIQSYFILEKAQYFSKPLNEKSFIYFIFLLEPTDHN